MASQIQHPIDSGSCTITPLDIASAMSHPWDERSCIVSGGDGYLDCLKYLSEGVAEKDHPISLFYISDAIAYKLGSPAFLFHGDITREADKRSLEELVEHAEGLIQAHDSCYKSEVKDIKFTLSQVPILSAEKRERYAKESE